MNKLFFSLLTILLCSTETNAQGWAIGNKALVGHSWTVGNRAADEKYKFHPTVMVGRNAVYNINKNVGLGLGTFFSTEGVTFENSTTDIRTQMRMNYIRIPLFANFNFGDARSRIMPRLSIGPSVGFLVGGKMYAINDKDAFIGVKTVKGMNTKIDAGINASLGFNIRVVDGFWINHDINYYHGLVEQEPNVGASGSRPSFTHRNIGLSLGFLVSCNALKDWKAKMHKGMNKNNMHFKRGKHNHH